MPDNIRGNLPSGATAASELRYHLASQMAQLCPPILGHEIILTGSVSRGIADDHSDIEQVFYVDTLPSMDERDQWLRHIYATSIMHDSEPIEDGSIWSTFLFRDIWVEAGWQLLHTHEQNLRSILSGNVTDHHQLKLADITARAIPLRSNGFLSQWQQALSHYPETLPAKLIRSATELWMFPHLIAARWALVQRNDTFALAERLVDATHDVLRILFALNMQWETDWKWIEHITQNLLIKPERLSERINSMCFFSSPEQSMRTCLQLLYDTLLLVPEQYAVSQALTAVRESLSSH